MPPGSPFAGDDGSADPEVATLLAQYARGEADLAAVVAAIGSRRVLVPVLAELLVGETVQRRVPGRDGHEGHSADLHVDKEAAAGVVAIEAPDGRRALPIFTSVAAMRAWQPQARPVPVTAERAALSAVSEDWSLLVLDPAGPVTVVLPRPAVWALARGQQWTPAVHRGVVDAAVADAIHAAVAKVAQVITVECGPGSTSEIAIRLGIEAGLDGAALQWVIGQVNAALAASETLGERVDGLELRVSAVPRRSPS